VEIKKNPKSAIKIHSILFGAGLMITSSCWDFVASVCMCVNLNFTNFYAVVLTVPILVDSLLLQAAEISVASRQPTLT